MLTLAVLLALVGGAQAQNFYQEVDFLLRICEANPGVTVPKYSGSGPLCGDGYVSPVAAKQQTAFGAFKAMRKKPPQYRRWSVTTSPCTDNWRSVYCTADGRHIKSLSLADLDLEYLPDPSDMVHLEVRKLAHEHAHAALKRAYAATCCAH